MASPELQQYLDLLKTESSAGLYVSRRFSAATNEGGAEPDLGIQFRGVLRDREPALAELLNHPRVVILGEPGAGKSVVARAAVRTLIEEAERVPVYSELKQYRADFNLVDLLKASVPAWLLDVDSSIDGKRLARTYVLDGVDEIPTEALAAFGKHLDELLTNDKDARAFLTARQAFYVANRGSLPQFPAVFHILDFSDDDIREYIGTFGTEYEAFMNAVRQVDAADEIRNPFVLGVMLERFSQAGGLSQLRSDNLSFIIDSLIQSRPLIGQHKQRRVLCMLAVAMETYCRNELTESEALQIIKQAMPITEAQAPQLLHELYGSILRRTANGFAFQMRSYGEYLAAEALENDKVEKLRELAFIDYGTPNESWMNCVSYLAELNAGVRKLFVRQYPLWMLTSSPTVFSDEEKEQIVRGVLATVAGEGQYIYGRPGINIRRLGRFLTPITEAELLEGLKSDQASVRANSLLLLSWGHPRRVEGEALAALKNHKLDGSLRTCAIFALTNSPNSRLVPELMPLLDKTDPLYTNILDLVGAVCDETQLNIVLPMVVKADAMLSNTFYHFREFRSREALVETLRYFATHPEELTWIRSEGYVEPIIKLIPQYWDREIAGICADIIQGIEHRKLFLSNAGVGLKIFNLVAEADKAGMTATLYLERLLTHGEAGERRFYFTDQLVASLMKPETAQWLIERGATTTIQELSRFSSRSIREILRPHSDGYIDEMEKNTIVYEIERTAEQDARKVQITLLQEQLLAEDDFGQALNIFHQLTESHWPELPTEYKDRIAREVSKLMERLDLENSIKWNEEAVSYPGVLPLLLKLINRYVLKLDPDVPIIFCVTMWHETLVADYYRRWGLSEKAQESLDTLLTKPKSPRSLNGPIGFLRESGLWSRSIQTGLEGVVRGHAQKYNQVDALNILAQHEVETSLLEEIHSNGEFDELRLAAFVRLVERQHRPTIERKLSELLADEKEFKSGERYPPIDMPFAWIGKIRAEFAIEKLAKLREKALKFELAGQADLITQALAQIDRTKAAAIIKRQIQLAPESWRRAQQYIAIEQERTARIEKIHNSPFESILNKLRGSTTLRRLKVVCEGQSDVPVFKELLSQIPDVPEMEFDFVGGWGGLAAKDSRYFQQGCNESIVVMDGDLGRKLNKSAKPLTDLAKAQMRRLAGLPVDLRILERYGIENYFPQGALEQITGENLAPYFPIPDHVAVVEYLRESKADWKHRVKLFLVSRFRMSLRFSGRSLYSKNHNEKVAQQMCLEHDLKGSDLFTVVHAIAEKAKLLAG